MKNWWLTQSARINALSLRERVFVFISILVCCLAVVVQPFACQTAASVAWGAH